MEGLCILCKDHITTPLSIENIGNHIRTWLPNKFKKEFSRINSGLNKHIGKFYKNTVSGKLICTHCYVKEVYDWLIWRDKKLAERFISVFSFGYSKASYQECHQEPEVKDHFEGDILFGICDECGEYTEELEYFGGEWICEDCSSFRDNNPDLLGEFGICDSCREYKKELSISHGKWICENCR